METGGRSTHQGINAQDWAAISLFLQYFPYANLDYIAFEQPKLKDFNLVFTSGRKIICESKSFRISYADIRDILSEINPDDLNKNDEILIICEEVGSDVKQDVEYYKYYEPSRKKLEKKGFKESHFKLLPHLHFWEVKREANEQIATDLFSKSLGMWVSEEDLQEMLDSIVLREVYFGSEAGSKLLRKHFFDELEERKEKIKARSGYYTDKETKIQQIETAIDALNHPENHKDWSPGAISSLTASPDLHYLTIKRLKEQKDLNLTQWDALWVASVRGAFALEVLNIFKQNAHLEINQEYLINLLPKVTNWIVDLFHDRFYGVDVIKICQKIFLVTDKYNKQIFQIIQQVLDRDVNKFLYVKNNDDMHWEHGEIANVLRDLYFRVTDKKLKRQIINYILTKFNLVEDDGELWHDTPPSIFEILKKYSEEEPPSRILELSKGFANQFHTNYKRYGKRYEYKGWEHSAGSGDRHIVSNLLQPVLTDYYNKDSNKAWEFMISNCLTRDWRQVSLSHPDFMNRIGFRVLLKEFEGGEHKEEAFEILSDLIKMKGLPIKAELIFRLVREPSLSDDDKWKLIKVQLDHPPFRGLPLNEVEEIVNQLAQKSYDPAIKQIESWAANEEYNKKRHPFEPNVIDSLSPLFKTQTKSIQILKDFIKSDHFINDLDKFKVWDVAKVLSELLKVNYIAGKEILDSISKKRKTSANEQTLLTSVLSDISEGDSDLLKKVYEDIVSNWFDSSNDEIKKLIKIFPNSENRESIVWFGSKLARVGLHKGALRIAKVFVNDPDPKLESPDKQSSWHKQIEDGEDVQSLHSVRTKVSYLLEHLIVAESGKYIPNIIPLVKQLTEDSNYYVRSHSCVPLEKLVHYRNICFPKRLVTQTDSDKIVLITWKFLKSKENHRLKQVMRNFTEVIGVLRNLTETEAKELFNLVISTKDPNITSKSSNIMLYYAEFRKDIFKNRKFIKPYGKKKWEQLNNYDSNYFRNELKKLLSDPHTSSIVKSHMAWILWKLPKEQDKNYKRNFKIALQYLSLLIKEYNKETYTNIYYFIDENLDKNYHQVIKLWKNCLTKEKEYYVANFTKDKIGEIGWLPCYFNGKILVKIGEKEGEEEFVQWLEHLITYPESIILSHDMNLAVDYLVTLPKADKNKYLFDEVVSRFPEYYDKRKIWLEN